VSPANPPSLRTARRQTLILLPGALCDAALFRHQIAGLADIADVRVGDLTRDESVGAMAARTLAGLTGRFALAGLSLGGFVALEIMRRAPERVTRLALLDTAARAGESESDSPIAAIPISGRPDGALPVMSLLVHPMRLSDRRLTTILAAMADRVGRKAFHRQQQASQHRPDSWGNLKAIRCPTMLLTGRQDRLAPPELQQAMAAVIEGARQIVIEECGHLSPLERPEAVTKALREWLGQPAAMSSALS
jgi:pimeloyl-ACP methyl ester carboxylesterase